MKFMVSSVVPLLSILITFYQDPHESDRKFILHYGDLSDSSNLIRIVLQIQPDEIYNLGAQSHVDVSFESPEYTADTVGMGVKYYVQENGPRDDGE